MKLIGMLLITHAIIGLVLGKIYFINTRNHSFNIYSYGKDEDSFMFYFMVLIESIMGAVLFFLSVE